ASDTSLDAVRRTSLDIELISVQDESENDDEVTVYGPLVTSGDGREQHTNWTGIGTMLYGRADGRPGFPGEDKYGKLITTPGCFICPNPETDVKTLKGRDLLSRLDTNTMITYMLNSEEGLKDKCVFYSRAEYDPPGRREGLSKEASVWACSRNKISIWVCLTTLVLTRRLRIKHLWPNKVMADQDPANFLDFYDIENKDNWLHTFLALPPIPEDRGVPTHIQYFENMSEAMAKSCTGEVVVVSQTPEDMGRYVRDGLNIWASKERPALMANQAAGKISRFLVVEYGKWNNIWEFDIKSNARGNKVDPKDLKSRELHALWRRACSSGVAQKLSAGDQFADDYKYF
ncbi:hypothetical protein V8F33_013245, partial [Rhypophila sp. PSN 637]